MTTFNHNVKGCRAPVLLDLSSAVRLLTPSFVVSIEGFSVGVVEFEAKEAVNVTELFHCGKCSKKVAIEDLTCQCMVCRENKPLSSMYSVREINQVCESCLDGLSAKEYKGDSLRVREVREWIHVGKDFEKVPMISLLQGKFAF